MSRKDKYKGQLKDTSKNLIAMASNLRAMASKAKTPEVGKWKEEHREKGTWEKRSGRNQHPQQHGPMNETRLFKFGRQLS